MESETQERDGQKSGNISVLPLIYQPAPGWELKEPAAGIARAIGSAEVKSGGATPQPAQKLKEESGARERLAREEGFKEGMNRARIEADLTVRGLRDGIAETLREFLQERENYFHHVESEVVMLALAIVRKILRREAQVDPLLLSGLVRVALEKMGATQSVKLRVNPSQVAAWQEHFFQHDEMPLAPEVSGDSSLEQYQCRLETEMGVTDLSLEMQLKEIEKGLFDLLAQRPAPHQTS